MKGNHLNEILHKLFKSAPASLDMAARTIEFIASSEVEDRMGDIVIVSGIDVSNYLKNPVVLFGHDSKALPVGKAVNIEKANRQLLIKVQFATAADNPEAEKVFKLYQGGYMNAVSIGFIPREVEFILDENSRPTGVRYLTSELLELSCVPVPANPQALAKSAASNGVNEILKQLCTPPAKPAPKSAAPNILDLIFKP
jgi:uncharacterized protein